MDLRSDHIVVHLFHIVLLRVLVLLVLWSQNGCFCPAWESAPAHDRVRTRDFATPEAAGNRPTALRYSVLVVGSRYDQDSRPSGHPL